METPRYQPAVTNSLAVASLVIAILSFVTCGGMLVLPLVGLILGTVALSQISSSHGRQTGSSLAAVGLALNLCSVVMLPILAAILFPVFAQAREKARQSACQSNEKQIALAAQMYLQDYDERFPRVDAPWSDLLDTYLKSEQVYHCPTDDNGPPSYQVTAALRGTELGRVIDAQTAILLFESDDEQSVAWRHNEGANFAYVDGHVKWLSETNNPARPQPEREIVD